MIGLLTSKWWSIHTQPAPSHHHQPTNQMATFQSPRTPPLLLMLFTFFLVITPPPSHSLPYTKILTLCSRADSLITRALKFRASCCNNSGSVKADSGKGPRSRGTILSCLVCAFELAGVLQEAYEFLSLLNELFQTKSEDKREDQMRQKYSDALMTSAPLLFRLQTRYNLSGHFGVMVEIVCKALVQRDWLNLVSNDLKGMTQILTEIVPPNRSTSDKSHDEL